MNKDYLNSIASWCPDVDDEAVEQAKRVVPFAYNHVALMPDAHVGFGVPIGCVFGTEDVIIPNAIGVDIGCGMCAVRTNGMRPSVTMVKNVMGVIRELVPVGFNHHKEKQAWDWFERHQISSEVVEAESQRASYQLGTLGGGNHFIELQVDDSDTLWVMIHSGSRHLGLAIAKHYHELAKKMNARWHSESCSSDIALLPLDSDEGKGYIDDMHYALTFAKENRSRMMDTCIRVLEHVLCISEESRLDVHHNYADIEHHFGRNLWVHRKGAIRARAGEAGIIPGSQGSSSYIVEGLGNHVSLTSCSHGAGRTMSRKGARAKLNLADEIKKLDDQGIVHGIRHQNDLDEAAGAYKDIDTVMANQTDLVKVVTKLRPIGVIKG